MKKATKKATKKAVKKSIGTPIRDGYPFDFTCLLTFDDFDDLADVIECMDEECERSEWTIDHDYGKGETYLGVTQFTADKYIILMDCFKEYGISVSGERMIWRHGYSGRGRRNR